MIQKKKCSKCREPKLFDEFHKMTSNTFGLDAYCKTCRSTQGKEWRENNSEKNAENKRIWFLCKYHTDPEFRGKNRIRLRDWRKINPTKIKQHNKTEYQKRKANPERKVFLTKWQKERSKRGSKNLTDRYVKGQINRQLNIPSKDIPQGLIESKREQILFYRELKTFKKEIQHGIA